MGLAQLVYAHGFRSFLVFVDAWRNWYTRTALEMWKSLRGHVAELVYAHGLEPCLARGEGSSPSVPTKDLYISKRGEAELEPCLARGEGSSPSVPTKNMHKS